MSEAGLLLDPSNEEPGLLRDPGKGEALQRNSTLHPGFTGVFFFEAHALEK